MPERRPPFRPTDAGLPWWALVAVGGVVVALVLLGGWLAERWWFGPDLEKARARVEREVRERVDDRLVSLRRLAEQLAGSRQLVEALQRPENGTGGLFDLLTLVIGPAAPPDLSVTIYGSDRVALAWRGRPAAVPADRLDGSRAVFVSPGPLGLRLVHVEPVFSSETPGRQLGLIAAERVVSPARSVSEGLGEDVRFDAAGVPVTLSPHIRGVQPPDSPWSFVVAEASGTPLLDAAVEAGDLGAARAAWRRATIAIAAVCVTAMVLVSAVLARRRLIQRGAARAGWLPLLLAVVSARLLLWVALPGEWRPPISGAGPGDETWLLRSPVDLVLHALAALGVVVALAEAAFWWRLRWRIRRAHDVPAWNVALWLATQLGAGVVASGIVLGADALVRRAALAGVFNVSQLVPYATDVPRLLTVAGLVLLHVAAAWASALAFSAAMAPWRPWWTTWTPRMLAVAAWVLPAVALGRHPALHSAGGREPLLVVLLLAVALAWAGRRGVAWYRHASHGRRLVALALLVVVPTLAMYPALWSSAERAREHTVESRYAVQALTHPQELQTRLAESLSQIDRIADLAELVHALPEDLRDVPTDTAFAVWQRTELAASRLTSAVEIYGEQGRLVSRFALNFPEYAALNQHWHSTTCSWEVFGEAAPFGAEERRMLHAERALCDPDGRPHGAIVVHVMLDYSALPFISSQSPYFEFFRTGGTAARAAVATGADVVLVVYGWGRTPIYASAGRAWVLAPSLFERVYRTRDPFWTEVTSDGRSDKVFVANDRFGIYAVGYTRASWFDHCVHLVELATLALLLFLILRLGASAVRAAALPRTTPAWSLAREVRSSFSRKLFLAFVAAAIMPVLVLAFSIRAYVAAGLRADIEAEAARTAAIAQRVIQESLAAQRGGEISASALNDDIMVWISRVIDQDVNIFVGAELVATSERDLYASGLLPTRVSDRVYRAVVLDRMPAFVGEDQIADLRYLMAAAPIRLRGVDALLTVPLALQQREIEREIRELDRGVQLGAAVFILLGAAVGYWLAQRISDPVERLTRASRRIASGELSARVFVRTADELQRLVEAFNTMAVELERQRAQLEHTNRLEAWAEMARQVAHDIKNPLTPIQLSAEHLRRVHRDRGEPMSPVLDRCVDTILAQVRLLRRISAEFSSFASTPALRREPTDVGDLLRELLEGYKAGLDDRYTIDVAVEPALPQVSLDRLLVGRAVTNVIENALYAMPSGGRLSIAAARVADELVVRVTDTGVGMDEEARARVFEPYFSTRTTGTGLGLPIAKRNVDLHGGSVTVDSAPGAGTTVTFRLPLGAASR